MASSNLNSKALFDQIDDFFNSKKESEVSMFYVLIVLIIGYVVYEFVYLQTDENLRKTENKVTTIKQAVNQNKNYLSHNTQQRLDSLRHMVGQKQVDYDNTLFQISYVDNKLTELSYLLFNDEHWAKFVDNISYLAKKNQVEIKEIGNKFFTPTYQKITHVVEINIKSKAKFTNLIKFVNDIEESPLVIDINEVNMTKPDDEILSQFKIAVWGMKY